LIWYNPLRSKYLRLNKNGKLFQTPVSKVCWLPGSRCLLLAAFADGRIAVFDKEKEDNPGGLDEDWQPAPADYAASPESAPAYFLVNSSAELKKSRKRYNPQTVWKLQPPRRKRHNLHFSNNSAEHALRSGGSRGGSFSQDAVIAQQRPPLQSTIVTSIEFRQQDGSSDRGIVSITTSSGAAYLLDLGLSDCGNSDQQQSFDCSPRVLYIYHSYFGGFSCSKWSPDGQYLALGGQDDSIIIVSLRQRRIIYRLEGHHNWVSDLLFLPSGSKNVGDDVGENDDCYRLLSVGEDGRLCIWEIEREPANGRRHTLFSLPRRKANNQLFSAATEAMNPANQIIHQAPSALDTAVLTPVLSQRISARALTSVASVVSFTNYYAGGGLKIAAVDRSGGLQILQLSSIEDWS
jgi:WD40 repeat protein